MKRKLLIGFICVPGLIVALWIIGRLTGGLQYYTASTSSNEPTIKHGSTFFASNIIEPERFDLICYKTTSPYKGDTWVHRLCGLPGDTIQIKNGELYVNGKLADDQFNLANDYFIAKKDYEKLSGSLSVEEETYQVTPDTLIALIADADIKNNHLNTQKYISAEPDPTIDSVYAHPWSMDEFGPLIIPANNYFVLGDNRHRSNDSRFTGLVPKENFCGTIIGK